MRTSLAAIAALIATVTWAADGPAQVTVKRTRPGGSYAELLLEIRNISAQRLSTVRVSCAVFDKAGEVLGADDGYAENVEAGATAYKNELVAVPRDLMAQVDKGVCRVVSAD